MEEKPCGLDVSLPTPSREQLRELIVSAVGEEKAPATIRTVTDTTDFFQVDFGDVVLLGGRPYLVRNNEREGRFGLDDEPKFWVKRAIDLLSGEIKIIKLCFAEKFQVRVGKLVFDFIRSPGKEARILDLVKDDRRFMQGFSVKDGAGNTVRIIDYIVGKTLAEKVLTLGGNHEDYFFRYFPGILDIYLELADAIFFLHSNGEKHGDIRRDHILVDGKNGDCRWIDFDFNFHHAPDPYLYDLFGLGNILVYLAGRGDVTLHELRRKGDERLEKLNDDDQNIVFKNRVVNLRKIYPYIPDSLNRVFMHFSAGAGYYFETVGELIDDVRAAAGEIGAPHRRREPKEVERGRRGNE